MVPPTAPLWDLKLRRELSAVARDQRRTELLITSIFSFDVTNLRRGARKDSQIK